MNRSQSWKCFQGERRAREPGVGGGSRGDDRREERCVRRRRAWMAVSESIHSDNKSMNKTDDSEWAWGGGGTMQGVKEFIVGWKKTASMMMKSQRSESGLSRMKRSFGFLCVKLTHEALCRAWVFLFFYFNSEKKNKLNFICWLIAACVCSNVVDNLRGIREHITVRTHMGDSEMRTAWKRWKER